MTPPPPHPSSWAVTVPPVTGWRTLGLTHNYLSQVPLSQRWVISRTIKGPSFSQSALSVRSAPCPFYFWNRGLLWLINLIYWLWSSKPQKRTGTMQPTCGGVSCTDQRTAIGRWAWESMVKWQVAGPGDQMSSQISRAQDCFDVSDVWSVVPGEVTGACNARGPTEKCKICRAPKNNYYRIFGREIGRYPGRRSQSLLPGQNTEISGRLAAMEHCTLSLKKKSDILQCITQ